MNIAAAGSAIYASFGSPYADALTGSVRRDMAAERQASDAAAQAAQASVASTSSGTGNGSATPWRGTLVNMLV